MNRLYPAEPPAVPPSGVLQQAGRGAGTDDGAPVHGVALYLEPGSNAAAVAARLERELSGDLEIVPNHRLRERALAVFDQTMAVTGLLEVFALAIAAIGIALSLWTLARERSAESALLRALGESRRQVAAGFLGRGALIGGLALALGGGTGAILTLLLVRVVNPLWFGWSLDLHWPVGSLAGEGAVVVLVGVLAAALPARLASRTGAAALVEEV